SGHVRDVDGSTGEARDRQRARDRLLLDAGWSRPREVFRLTLSVRDVFVDQSFYDASVLAVDPHQQAESGRRRQDLEEGAIGGHETLLGKRQEQFDHADAKAWKLLEVLPGETVGIAEDRVQGDVDLGVPFDLVARVDDRRGG